ncbi:MAG: serine hydroxymethyltransferase [Planctomycetota bacterium]|nr:serine hydroxymethyltransferase [Planctomycetota bacterium]
MLDELRQFDPEIFNAVRNEVRRQHVQLEMIASENHVSLAVLQALGSVMTNKYAEGYPGRRYYGGCEFVDVAENVARDRVKELFGAVYANVQPHSGSQANMAVYFTFLKPGDTVLGMDLSHGGHLTHGASVNFSGQLYRFVAYGIDKETETINYDQVAEVAKKEKPKMITVGASAYSRIIDYARFRQIADSVGAFMFADIAHPAGLIAKGLLPSPIPHCHIVTTTTHKTLRGVRGGLILMGKDFENPFGIKAAKSGRVRMMSELVDSMVIPGVQGGPLMHVIAAKAVGFKENLQPSFLEYSKQVIKNAQTLANALVARGYHVISGGTDNHLMLIDLRNKKIKGKPACDVLDKVGITVNSNKVPYDTGSPLDPMGIRIGSPACTTRGLKEKEFELIADVTDQALSNPKDSALHEKLRKKTTEVCEAFPLYGPMMKALFADG